MNGTTSKARCWIERHDLEGALLDLRGDLTPHGIVGSRQPRGAQRFELLIVRPAWQHPLGSGRAQVS
jgi:hypothetical protein